ncbi:MAG: biotin carboxylase N-terminal domain-containing protein, partial [Pseudomonadota bacterium]
MNEKKVLIANRGEIAVRVIQACKDLELQTVLASSEADLDSLGAKMADQVTCIGPAMATDSYLKIDKVIDAAKEWGVDAIHPGYGFLAENAGLPEACELNSITFIGPSSDVMRQLGDKISARALAKKLGVPMAEGSAGLDSFSSVEAEVAKAGYPVIFKAAAGGGGRGMRIVREAKELKTAFDMASNEALSAFGDPRLFVESYIENARHVEVQIIGDKYGNVVHVGMRDCSPQRRHQKVIEEAPPYDLSDALGERILESAVELTSSIGYSGAGTVEFLVDKDRDAFYFMEVNTR